MRIVVDTMVFISGATVSNSPSSQIMQLWAQGKLEIATSELILLELARVMTYPEIQRFLPYTNAQITRYVRNIRRGAYLVNGTTPVSASPDPDDNKFFACAIEAEAAYLVSKDRRHILPVGSYMGVQVIRPDHFIEQVIQSRKGKKAA